MQVDPSAVPRASGSGAGQAARRTTAIRCARFAVLRTRWRCVVDSAAGGVIGTSRSGQDYSQPILPPWRSMMERRDRRHSQPSGLVVTKGSRSTRSSHGRCRCPEFSTSTFDVVNSSARPGRRPPSSRRKTVAEGVERQFRPPAELDAVALTGGVGDRSRWTGLCRFASPCRNKTRWITSFASALVRGLPCYRAEHGAQPPMTSQRSVTSQMSSSVRTFWRSGSGASSKRRRRGW